MLLVERVKRAILLQINPTTKKDKVLNQVVQTATSEFNRLWDERNFCPKFMDFHKKVYVPTKERTGFNSQIICDIERSVWKSKEKSKGITLKFNVPRNCKTFDKSMSFVKFSIFSKNPIAIPIVKNRNYQRYSDLLKTGWSCKTYGLTSDLQIVAYLSKEETKLPQRKNVLGIDINSKCLAITVLSPDGKVLHQNYLGLDMWTRRKRFMERRSKMQSSFNLPRLRKIKIDEYNFVANHIGEIVRDITNLALKYDADIAIENLKRFSKKSKKFNREVMRIPFLKIKQILLSRCFDKGITIDVVDAWHTSKFCSHCGAVGEGHSSKNYALFICKKCGVVVNSDRNASKNIAIKSLLGREDSLNQKLLSVPNGQGLVNAPLLFDEVGLPNVAVQHAYQPDGKPPNLLGG